MKFRPPCDAIIFDLDGTLWDASPSSAIAWSRTARDLGIPLCIDEVAVKGVSGLPFDKCVDAIFGSYGEKVPDLRALLNASEQREIIERGGRYYEGMLVSLRQLAREYKLFLVSNCQEWYLNAFFKHANIRELFHDSLCFGQTNRPKAENIKEIVKRNSLQRPVYVGDTHWDQEQAYYAGVQFIFARFGFGSTNISCPSVGNFRELVDLMTAPTLEPKIELRKLSTDEVSKAQSFYASVGYSHKVQPQDKFFAAFDKSEMVGLVRLAFECGSWILRGMQINPHYQFFGIGTKLLGLLENDLGSEACFCLPHAWLEKFYSQIGFKSLRSMAELPKFLQERMIDYRTKFPQLIAMKRQ